MAPLMGDDTDGEDLSVFPNPATNQFTIAFQQQKSDTRISVFDVNGRQVYYTEVPKNDSPQPVLLTVSRSEMFVRPGIYFVRMVNDEKAMTRKLLIED